MEVNVIRVVKDKNFTIMKNTFLKDQKLSLKGRGLMATILSLKDDWDLTISGLSKILKEGRGSISKGINELIELGYCQRETCRDESGKFKGYNYTFFEEPINKEIEPYPENPYTENPYPDNRTQLSTNKLNTINNKTISFFDTKGKYQYKSSFYYGFKNGDTSDIFVPEAYINNLEDLYKENYESYWKGESELCENHFLELLYKEFAFNRFWNEYDKKVDLKKSKDKFMRLGREDILKIRNTLDAYIHKHSERKYRKNPTTYINNRCWEDELDTRRLKLPKGWSMMRLTEEQQALLTPEQKKEWKRKISAMEMEGSRPFNPVIEYEEN